jgi:hypothetical protein
MNIFDVFQEFIDVKIIKSFEPKTELNKQIWKNKKLNSKIREDLLDIATKGVLRGKTIVDKLPGRSSYMDFAMHRANLINLYSISPDYANALVENEVLGIHGSTSASLLGVLQHGLRPQEVLTELGVLVASGEGVFAGTGWNKDHVSFAQWDYLIDISRPAYIGNNQPLTVKGVNGQIQNLETAAAETHDDFKPPVEQKLQQARQVLSIIQKHPETEEELQYQELLIENFPVIYHINQSAQEGRTVHVPQSDVGKEFGIEGGVPVDNIKIILVPEVKIAKVQQLIQERGLNIGVFPIEIVKTFRRHGQENIDLENL